MKVGIRSFMLLIMLICSSLSEPCPPSEMSRVESQYRSCEAQAERRFLLKPSRSNVCAFIDDLANGCSRTLALCMDDHFLRETTRTTVQVHVDRIRKLYGLRRPLSLCSSQNTRLSSSPSMSFAATSKCSSAQVATSASDYRKCGHNSRLLMMSKLRNSSGGRASRRNIVCSALDDLMTICFEKLRDCHEQEELDELRDRQKNLLIALFFPFAEKMTFNLRDCNAFKSEETNDDDKTFDKDIENNIEMNQALLSASICSNRLSLFALCLWAILAFLVT